MFNRRMFRVFAPARAAAVATAVIAAAGSAGRAQTLPAADKELKNLTSQDYTEREAASKHLQSIVAEQLKQRAAIQEVMSSLQSELAGQQAALAVVSDEEAQAQIAGLLEMERGLAGWTAQTMSEPLERRKNLLDWGLSRGNAPLLAQVYADGKRARLEGVKKLGKLADEGAGWTLAQLINDHDTPVRAAAMAAVWNRKPTAEIINALWYRAVSGPLAHEFDPFTPAADMRDRSGGPDTLHVDFPGGDPLDFDDGDESNKFFDSQLASDVLMHLNSNLVADKVKELVAQRLKSGRGLAMTDDPDWTQTAHQLVETYAVKEAIPMLAAEALGTESEQMGGDMNGRPFAWSRRTLAIGTLARLIGKDPADFDLIRARDTSDPRNWMWACDVDQQAMMSGNMSDGMPVRAFYTFWKDHHADFGIKEEPSNAGVPPAPARGGKGRGFGGRPTPADPPAMAPDGKLPLNNVGPAADIAPAPDALQPEMPAEAPAHPQPR